MFDLFFNFLWLLVLARVILSWVNVTPNPITDFIYQLTEPLLAPIRRLLPPSAGLDFSPLILMLILSALQTLF